MKQSRALTYEEATHRIGRIWMLSAAALFLLVPVSVSIFYDAWPPIKLVGEGLLGVAPIFWTVGVIEAFTFIPMLGSGGSYLAFVTGNLTNLKVPCVLNALQAAKIDPGTEKAEAISTIAVAVSSIVTTLIIALGVILLGSVQPILQSPALAPAFENILPALFGALAVVFVSKAWKIAIAPLVFMTALFIAVPSLAGSVGVLVPVGAALAMGAARILYKKNLL